MSTIQHEAPPHHASAPWQHADASDLRVLITLRSQAQVLGGHWELPGGKIEPDESPQDAAVRELREEVGIDIKPVITLPHVDHSYEHACVRLLPFICQRVKGLPRAIEVDDVRWVQIDALSDYKFPEASLPVIASLIDTIHHARLG